MKRWLAISFSFLVAGLLCLALNAQAQMMPLTGAGGKFKTTAAGSSPIALLASVTTGSSNGTDVTSATIDSTGANLLIAVVSDFLSGTPTVTDSKSNTWTGRTAYGTGNNIRVRLFYSVPTSVGSAHTVSYTGAAPSIAFLAFSSANAVPYDTEVGAEGTSATPTAGLITPSADNSLIISAVDPFGTTASPASVDAGFTIVGSHIERTGNHFGLDVAYLIQTALGAVNPAWTEPDNSAWSATNAVFKN